MLPSPGTARTAWPGRGIVQIGDQFQHILGKILDVALQGPAQRQCGALVGARRAAHAQIDAAGKQRRQGAELLGDHQRRMIGQHDAAGADADGGGAARDMADHDAVAALAMPGML